MKTNETSANWITVEEMAKTLSLPKSSAYSLLATGDVDAIKIGRSVRVDKESLKWFISRNPYVKEERESNE